MSITTIGKRPLNQVSADLNQLEQLDEKFIQDYDQNALRFKKI